jgi:hypothetical protein
MDGRLLHPAMASRSCFLIIAVVCAGARVAAESPVELPAYPVSSPRVALQDPVGSFAMPVTALRYEPLLDVEARNQAEEQADIAVRGGIFENTGFRIGGVSLYDPQTGHYFAELPVAPAMISAPGILTGVDNALGGFNASVGTVAYEWQAIRPLGKMTATAGQNDSYGASLYEGLASDVCVAGRRLAADAELSRSASDGSVPFGDHCFQRCCGRLQLAGGGTQTDLFYGYQGKFFGWPNLYTPFGSDESENLETVLLALNHRVVWSPGDWLEVAGFWRRNKDDYAVDRFAPLGPVHPFQHTTWAGGAAVSGHNGCGVFGLSYAAEVLDDDLKSTSLIFGRFHSRRYTKLSLAPDMTWACGAGRRITVRTGATLDDTNREASAVSPLAEIALEEVRSRGGADRVYLSYADSSQVPTYTALNSSPTSGLFRGNPNLGRTVSHSLEMGRDDARGAWQTHVAIFYRRDDHLVDWTFQRGVVARIASPVDIDTAGAETTLRWSASRCDLVVGYTYLHKRADYGMAVVDGSFYALNFPRQRLTAAVVARLGGGFELRMDNQARIQEADPLRTAGGNQAVISSLGLFFRPPGAQNLDFHLQADNLWGSAFQEVPAVPAPRREISTGVTCRW